MKKTLSFLITGFSLFSFAQQIISPEAVIGIWKLKEAGFYENNKKVKKDFDVCRLQRHYIIKADGTAIYNYYEGSIGDCYKSDPRETYWKITDGKLVFFIGNEIYQEEKIINFTPKSMIFNSIPLDASNEKDPRIAKILQTVHYENLEKISEEQLQQQLLH
ncbi:lipocalin family protein [Elizabethkingia ursingii]|uniref:lipocalin family protein n=1 Tax=Elizabethkingia ursingii TaxID=1756150 RepID=UPI0020115B3A|nr:lipocalin family protein [Elizabethkingia ursingii]MCL1666125.1 lipocalin family protein [Elizabethkingia ursingii]